MSKIKILSWNLLAQRYAEDPWKERFKLILARIDEIQPDILFFQEVEEEMKHDLVEQLHKKYHDYQYTPKQDKSDGTLIISKFYLDHVSYLALEGNQVATFVEIDGLTYVVVHLKSKKRNHEIRARQLRMILDYLKAVENKLDIDKTLIVGDFNEDYDEGSLYKLLKRIGFDHVYNKDIKTTKKIDNEGTSVHRKIDWIWFPTRLKSLIRPVTQIDQQITLPNLKMGHPSDHHPICAELELSSALL